MSSYNLYNRLSYRKRNIYTETSSNLYLEHQREKRRYRVKCIYGYTLLSDIRPRLDSNVDYFIVGYAPACDDRPIIIRCDGEHYNGEDRWIVDMHNLEEIK